MNDVVLQIVKVVLLTCSSVDLIVLRFILITEKNTEIKTNTKGKVGKNKKKKKTIRALTTERQQTEIQRKTNQRQM